MLVAPCGIGIWQWMAVLGLELSFCCACGVPLQDVGELACTSSSGLPLSTSSGGGVSAAQRCAKGVNWAERILGFSAMTPRLATRRALRTYKNGTTCDIP